MDSENEETDEEGFQNLSKSPKDEKIIQFVDLLIQKDTLPLFEYQKFKILPNFSEQKYIISEIESYKNNKILKFTHIYSHS